MQTTTRTLFASSLALVAVAGCGGGSSSGPTTAGPTAPSAVAGATVAGTVNRAVAGAPVGLTVTCCRNQSLGGRGDRGRLPDHRRPHRQRSTACSRTRPSTPWLSSRTSRRRSSLQIQVNVNGTTATILNEARSTGKVSLCHRTGNGSYHLIDVSVNAEPAHRAHGDGKIGDPVPGDTTKVFDRDCRPVGASVRIKKSTNGQDADEAPGPTIPVGTAVTWQYLVTNTGNVGLTNVVVVDDRNVTVSCPGATLAVGQSMTCNGSGVEPSASTGTSEL